MTGHEGADAMELAGQLKRAIAVSMRHYQWATKGAPYGVEDKEDSAHSRWWMESSLRYAARAFTLAQECRARKGEPEMAKWLDTYGISI